MTTAIVAEALSETEKYARILASDAAWDGRFYFGVVTTGGAHAAIVIPGWLALAVSVAASLVIGAQAVALLRHIRSLEQRCEGFDEVRAKIFRKYLRGVSGFTIAIVLMTCHIFSIRRMDTGGSPMLLVWLAAVSQIGETRKRLRREVQYREERMKGNRA